MTTIRQLIPVDALRCKMMAYGLLRCVLGSEHKGPCQFVIRGSRSVTLTIDHRLAYRIYRLAIAERKRRTVDYYKNQQSGWVPEPGKQDSNLGRIAQMEDLLDQIEKALEADEPKICAELRALRAGLRSTVDVGT